MEIIEWDIKSAIVTYEKVFNTCLLNYVGEEMKNKVWQSLIDYFIYKEQITGQYNEW